MESSPPPSDRLDSWKEIAAYLGRTEKTARRWEQTEGLPVHRLVHRERGSVYAYKSEIDAWRASRAVTAPPATVAAAEPDAPLVLTRSWRGVVALVAACGLGAAAFWLLPRETPAAAPPSLAVLPFTSAQSDPSEGDLGAAVAEAIVGHLAEAPDLRVRPFSSSIRHSAADADPVVAGREMGVDVVASGRVRSTDSAVEISVALVDVAQNSQIWGTTYQLAGAALGGTQEQIALTIRDRILKQVHGPSYEPGEYRPANVLSRNPEALRLYLRARGFPRNPGRLQIESSIQYLLEAVRLDPGFGAAHGALAIAHIALTFYDDTPPAESIGRATTHALKALEFDRESASGLMALAAASHWHDFDHPLAEKSYRELIAARPDNPGARNWYAEFLISLERFDEALEQIRIAGELDPGWLEVDTVRGNAHLYSGRAEDAVVSYLKALKSEPSHGLSRYFLGQAYLATGRVDDAVVELRRADEAMGQAPFSRAGLAYALARADARVEAEAILEEMTRRRRERYYPAFALAVVHLGLGESETALDWLDRAYDERLMGYYFPNVDPLWAPLRTHPRFRDLLRRLGVPDAAGQHE